MNVYDFDKTIFYPNSTVLFCRYCFRCYPLLMLKYGFKILWNGFLFVLNLSSLKKTEEQIFSFIKDVPHIEWFIERFWNKYQKNISDWYLAQKKSDDLIISASPEFLLKPITDRLGVNLLATKMDIKTCEIETNSCYAKEKTLQMLAKDYFENNTVDNFYSDSISDIPMALCAEHAFQVKKHATKVEPWPEFTLKLVKKFKRKYSKHIKL